MLILKLSMYIILFSVYVYYLSENKIRIEFKLGMNHEMQEK